MLVGTVHWWPALVNVGRLLHDLHINFWLATCGDFFYPWAIWLGPQVLGPYKTTTTNPAASQVGYKLHMWLVNMSLGSCGAPS